MISLIQTLFTSGGEPILWAQLLALLATMLLCLPIHEFAHAFAAYQLGDNTAKFKGRLTLNPLAHLSLWGTLLMLVAGVGYAKPVPVNPLNFKKRKLGMAITSAAGPLSNLLVAYIAMVLGKLVYVFGNNVPFAFFFIYLAMFNVSLAVFNLLPIPPLDGSRVLTLFLPERTYFKIMQYEQYIMIGLMLLVYLGIFDPVLTYGRSAILSLLDLATGFLGRIF